MFDNWMGNRDAGVVQQNKDVQNKAGGDKKDITNKDGNDKTNDVVDDNKLVEDVFQEHVVANGGDRKDVTNNSGDQQQQQQVDPKELKKQHLEEMGISPMVLSDEDKEAIKNGTFDFETLVTGMNQRVENAYMSSMRNANRMITAAVEKAVKDANTNTTTVLEGQRLKAFLHEGIPWIKGDPIVEPIAETAFGKFMKMTEGDQKKARDLTVKFLNRTAEAVNKNNPEFSFNSGSFRGKPQSDHEGDTDWLNAFRKSS